MAKKNAGMSTGQEVAIGAGIAALAGAAYLLFGPEGKKHRKDLKSWMLKMKAEALQKMEDAKELTGPVYEKIVSELEAKYKAMKNVDVADVEREIASLKKNWRAMTKQAKGKGKKVVKKAVAKKKVK
jgi:hypothetical protein